MFERYPIHTLIDEHCQKLGIRRSELVRRCGFKNISKGLRRLAAPCDGDVTSPGARTILDALPLALGVEASEVEKAVAETINIITRAKAEEEAEREASWRASFEPSACLVGIKSRPSSITIYGLSGGAGRWLRIPLDLSQPPITFATQALAVVRRTPTITFFGATKGFVVNYTPDRAVEFDADGNVVASFDRACRPGEAEIFVGKQRLPPRLLGVS